MSLLTHTRHPERVQGLAGVVSELTGARGDTVTLAELELEQGRATAGGVLTVTLVVRLSPEEAARVRAAVRNSS